MGDVVDEPVRIVPYDPAWPERFEEEKRVLEDALGPWIVGGVHHIGSTAVPGLAAKPTVDVMIGVESLEASADAQPAAEAVGYRCFPYRPDEFHWFCKPSPARRTHHLILVPHEHPRFRARLAFRDALRSDAELAQAYERLKRRLAALHEYDREAYTSAKGPFIEDVLTRVG
jgi:GrpB-like predicted nucleotidyltransferase (UPF0157 family)